MISTKSRTYDIIENTNLIRIISIILISPLTIFIAFTLLLGGVTGATKGWTLFARAIVLAFLIGISLLLFL